MSNTERKHQEEITVRGTLEFTLNKKSFENIMQRLHPDSGPVHARLGIPYGEQLPSGQASIEAMSGQDDEAQQTPIELLLDSRGVAKLLRMSRRTVEESAAAGKMPKPMKFGRLSRWSREELAAWVRAGCPENDEWVEMRGEKGFGV